MAIERGRPYSAFNYLVALGTGADTSQPRAGFQEVSGLGMEITAQEYRPGNYALNSPMKVMGMHKISDVTLKRGLIAALDLWEWLDAVRTGSQDALRTVTIQLQNEERTNVVMTWVLTNARPIKYTGPAFNGKGTDVGIEELVLAAEDMDLE
ncbi:MAG: phage tail protein [Litorilinea sp.]